MTVRKNIPKNHSNICPMYKPVVTVHCRFKKFYDIWAPMPENLKGNFLINHSNFVVKSTILLYQPITCLKYQGHMQKVCKIFQQPQSFRAVINVELHMHTEDLILKLLIPVFRPTDLCATQTAVQDFLCSCEEACLSYRWFSPWINYLTVHVNFSSTWRTWDRYWEHPIFTEEKSGNLGDMDYIQVNLIS